MATPNPTPTPPLTPDEIDDLLYLSRTNSTADLSAYLSSLSAAYAVPIDAVVLAAVDPETGNGLLHYAAANGHLEILTHLHAAIPSATRTLLNRPNARQNTPLHYACLNGQLGFAQALVAAGADTRVKNSAGHDAVFEAERSGHDGVVAWLLVEGGALDDVVGGLRGEEGAASGEGREEGEGRGDGAASGEGRGDGDGQEKEGDGEVRMRLGADGEVEVEEVRGGVEGFDIGEEDKGERKGKGRDA